jgi:hypothetical protein
MDLDVTFPLFMISTWTLFLLVVRFPFLLLCPSSFFDPLINLIRFYHLCSFLNSVLLYGVYSSVCMFVAQRVVADSRPLGLLVWVWISFADCGGA